MRFWLELALSNFRQLQIKIYLRIDKILPWAALEQLRDDLYAMRGMGTPTPFLAASLGVAPLRLARRYIYKGKLMRFWLGLALGIFPYISN